MCVDPIACAQTLLPRGSGVRRIFQSVAPAGEPAVIAIPAHDEVDTVEGCLRALDRAIAAAGLPARVLLLVNNSRDGTFERAAACIRRHALSASVLDLTLPAEHSHVGEARGTGMDLAACLAHPAGMILTTDADTRVDVRWLAENWKEFRRGAALVCGDIALDAADAARLPRAVQVLAVMEAHYLRLMRELETLLDPDPWNPAPHHGKAGGASLAASVAAYAQVGGLPRLAVSEDRALVERFRRHDLPVVFSSAARVVTSGRTAGRAEGGMADTLAARLLDREPPFDPSVEGAFEWCTRLLFRATVRRCHREKRDLKPVCRMLGVDPGMLPPPGTATFGGLWHALEATGRLAARRRLHLPDLAVERARLLRLVAAMGPPAEARRPPFHSRPPGTRGAAGAFSA